MRTGLRKFALRQEGTTTLEFVVLFVGFIAIMFFVVELTIYLFFLASLEKAAQAGVRAAVVRSPIVFGFPMTNQASRPGVFGMSCSDPSDPCVPFDDFVCDRGDDCRSPQFDRIVDHMHDFNHQIYPENVTITYTDVGIGFAGGPTVPMVTVTVRDIPFQTGIASLLLGNIGGSVSLPPRSASMTGEDLN